MEGATFELKLSWVFVEIKVHLDKEVLEEEEVE